ncbi:MAG: undecaprenyl-phosphate glucose phosphotransferase [Flavobacterium sp.]
MTALQKGRYSKYLRPISVLLDLLVITLSAYIFIIPTQVGIPFYYLYQALAWLFIAFFIGFYEVYRFTTPAEIFTKIVKQTIVFVLLIIAYFPFFKEAQFSGRAIVYFFIAVFALTIFTKFLLFYYLKRYRIITGSNFRKAVIVGYTQEAINLKNLFEKRIDYGYVFSGFFSDKKHNAAIQGTIEDLKKYVFDEKIDEIYCSINELTNEQIKDLVNFSDEHGFIIKFIPDSKQIFSKNLSINYYETFPVLSLQKTALHNIYVKIFKRLFDIGFSLLVFILILSWLAPLLALLIKLESRGPIFFKQGRPGLNGEEFFCYKFRSMKINGMTEVEASKNDPRVTKIGRFMRKTSIDEMPQFLNVMKGEMSIVGPRPHLWSQNHKYASKIKKYMVRLYVKPGITGLAQIKGYRGEIETDADMINRIKYDVFYIENWSFALDIKIIIQTIVNIFKGEEKAY